jgi:hypothetical protein
MSVSSDSKYLQLHFKEVDSQLALVQTTFECGGKRKVSNNLRRSKARAALIELLIRTKLDPDHVVYGSAANTLRDAFRTDKSYGWRTAMFGTHEDTISSFVEITRSNFTSAKWNNIDFPIDSVKFFVNGQEVITQQGIIELSENLGLGLEIPELNRQRTVVVKFSKLHLSELNESEREELRQVIIKNITKAKSNSFSDLSADEIQLSEGCVEARIQVSPDLAEEIVEDVNNKGLLASLGPAIAWIELDAPEYPSAEGFREDYDSCETLIDKFRIQSAYWRSIIESGGRVVFKNELEESSLDFGAIVLEAVLGDAKLRNAYKCITLVQFYAIASQKRWECCDNELFFYPGDKEVNGRPFARDIYCRLSSYSCLELAEVYTKIISSDFGKVIIGFRVLECGYVKGLSIEAVKVIETPVELNEVIVNVDETYLLPEDEAFDFVSLISEIRYSTDYWRTLYRKRRLLAKALDYHDIFLAKALDYHDIFWFIPCLSKLEAIEGSASSSMQAFCHPASLWERDKNDSGYLVILLKKFAAEWKHTTIGKLIWKTIRDERFCFLVLDEAYKAAELAWNLKVINREGLVDRFGNIHRANKLTAGVCEDFLSRFLGIEDRQIITVSEACSDYFTNDNQQKLKELLPIHHIHSNVYECWLNSFGNFSHILLIGTIDETSRVVRVHGVGNWRIPLVRCRSASLGPHRPPIGSSDVIFLLLLIRKDKSLERNASFP